MRSLPWPLLVLALFITGAAFLLILMGTWSLLTRRLPPPIFRFGNPQVETRPGPVRMGGVAVSVGTVLLIVTTTLLLALPRPVDLALLLLGFLMMIFAAGWFLLRRD